jgi:small subunit ribosomal protein S8
MSRTDLIADTLTVIRNGLMAKKPSVDVPVSKITSGIIQILKKYDYIDDFKPIESGHYKVMRVYLKYVHNKPAIKNLKRISKPGLRVYVSKDEIPHVLRGYGIAILSTTKGLLTDSQARHCGLGGEVLCYVW